jgi:hypothetical protein
MEKPLMHDVQTLMLPEHEAQLELQGTQAPLMAVKPTLQLATHLPLETIPEAQTQFPLLLGIAPAGQVV